MAPRKNESQTQDENQNVVNVPSDDEPQTKQEARTLDAEVVLPEKEQEKQGTGQGQFLSEPENQQHVSSLDPNLANLLSPEQTTGDMKKDAQRALGHE